MMSSAPVCPTRSHGAVWFAEELFLSERLSDAVIPSTHGLSPSIHPVTNRNTGSLRT